MIAPRLEALRSKLHEQKLDAMLVSSLPDIRYLSGFTGSHGLVLVTRSKQLFCSDGRYVEQSRDEVRGFEISISSESLWDLLRKHTAVRGLIRVGYESRTMTVADFAHLKKLFPRIEFVPASSIVPGLRTVKDRAELQLIKKAVGISDKVFQKILGIIKPGISEREVAAELTYWQSRFGAEADAFEPIVASGVRGALPHGRATDRRIRKGELVTLDFGCRFDGYHSDLTRTVSVGRPSGACRKIYRVVADAHKRALEAVRPGLAAKKLDAVARVAIRKQGFGKYFNHSLGHGLGLEVHEYPRVSRLSRETLVQGNVITVEPGVYVPGVGGVRIEDDVLVTASGSEVLTESPSDLIVL